MTDEAPMTGTAITEAPVVEAPAAEATPVKVAKPKVAAGEGPILIHVSFAPDGAVKSIGEKPSTLSEQEWFKRLSVQAADVYQPLAGGRGVFRVERARLDALKAAALH